MRSFERSRNRSQNQKEIWKKLAESQNHHQAGEKGFFEKRVSEKDSKFFIPKETSKIFGLNPKTIKNIQKMSDDDDLVKTVKIPQEYQKRES